MITSLGGGGGSGSGIRNYGGPSTASEDEWKFGFAGYMRAPMSVGIGERVNAKIDQNETTLSIPQLPNDQYLDWQYTQTVQRSWIESYFSYGNSWAKGVFSIEQFRFSQSTWPDPEANFGVGQAWIELTPDMAAIDENMRVKAQFGSFSGRYGGAGQYDAGAYDTFIIGRTHQVGETVRLEYDYNDYVFSFEEGFGTKEPNPSPFHNTKFTLLAHAHGGITWDDFITVNAHIMHAWTQEPDHDCASREEEVAFYENNQMGASVNGDDTTQGLLVQFAEAPVGACKQENTDGSDDFMITPDGPQAAVASVPGAGPLVRRSDTPDGSLTTVGIDAVFNTAALGRIFLGGSYVMADHAVTVAPAYEVIHAYGGGFFKSGVTHMYFNERSRWDSYDVMSAGGNGTILTGEAQWDLNLSSLIGPEIFGQQNLTAKLFGMFNLVQSDDDPNLENVSKLKYGTDILWFPTGWFGAGVRADRLEPRSDIAEQSFTAIAPRLEFRTGFTTHERIQIGYARYIYAQRECGRGAGEALFCTQAPGATVAPAGFANRPGINATKAFRGTPVDVESTAAPFKAGDGQIQDWDPPHENVVFISADMWW